MRAFGLEALIRSAHDGDTLYGDIDQGLGVWNRGLSKSGMGLRLWGCNAREIEDPGGPEARARLLQLVPIGSIQPIVCLDWDKWSGRIDVQITLSTGEDLVDKLIAEQWAARWNGKGAKPVPPWPRT